MTDAAQWYVLAFGAVGLRLQLSGAAGTIESFCQRSTVPFLFPP